MYQVGHARHGRWAPHGVAAASPPESQAQRWAQDVDGIDNPLIVSLMMFAIAGLAGLASLLRSPEPITRRGVASSMINSGLCGSAIVLIGYHWGGVRSVWLVLGLGILSGLAGSRAVEVLSQVGVNFLKAAAKKFGNGNGNGSHGDTANQTSTGRGRHGK